MSRTDDIINVAGHRLSTGGMEEVLSGHRDVAECAVIGIADALKGEVPMTERLGFPEIMLLPMAMFVRCTNLCCTAQ
jgi:AMP-binding enzyme C-terminal domain